MVRLSCLDMEIELASMSNKGQGVIPLALRKRLAIKEGEILAVSTKDDILVLKKVENPSEDDLKTLDEIKEA
jgi:AbrB family looped-hinge helix DNA binding protein